MKKTFLLCSMILCYLCGYAQSLTSVPSAPVASGSVITIKGVNESAESGYFYNIQYEPIQNVSTSPNTVSAVWVKGAIEQILPSFDIVTKNPSALTFKVSNSAPFPITVKFAFKVFMKTFPTTKPDANWITFVEITVKPVETPTVFYNVEKSQIFTKNNCPEGTVGSQYSYSVPAGKYQAPTQSEADAKAQNDLNVNGQNYVNTNGQCLTLYGNTAKTANFTKNNCAPNSVSSELIPFTIPAGRFKATSQTEADRLALNALNSEGQANANATGTCVKAIIYAKLVQKNYVAIVGGVDENGNPVPGSSIDSSVKKGDYYVELFSDAARTVPFNATNLAVTVKITKTTYWELGVPLNPRKVTISNVTHMVNGNDELLERDFHLLYVDGNTTNYQSKIELSAGDYIIIK